MTIGGYIVHPYIFVTNKSHTVYYLPGNNYNKQIFLLKEWQGCRVCVPLLRACPRSTVQVQELRDTATIYGFFFVGRQMISVRPVNAGHTYF